ncbi:hypothetical protein GCM10008023_11800 [Sphingomonas glacialis]|uniref:Uncharacterized protein n=1 Tax=Sphingomonas glacialis TaxID=658225 RepID=A0ABQ3LCN6_9SPHN|nr:hypothetical protein GCM10008023_11800 [Sphingomonas glacialis]
MTAVVEGAHNHIPRAQCRIERARDAARHHRRGPGHRRLQLALQPRRIPAASDDHDTRPRNDRRLAVEPAGDKQAHIPNAGRPAFERFRLRYRATAHNGKYAGYP